MGFPERPLYCGYTIKGYLAVVCCRPSLEGPAYPSGSQVRLTFSFFVISNGKIFSSFLN